MRSRSGRMLFRARTSVGTSKASRVNASPLGLRRQAHFLRVGTLTAPRITPAHRKGSASTQAEAPHSLETRRQFSPRRFAFYLASELNAREHSNGWGLNCARIPEKRIARACRHGVFAAQPRVPISSDHAAISIEAEDSRRSERSLRAPILCVPNVKRSADVRAAEHHWRDSASAHPGLQWCDYARRKHWEQCCDRRMGVGSYELPECKRVLFDLLEVFHGSAAVHSFSPLYQNLIQGSTRTDAGCTVDAPPKTDDDPEASREIMM